MNESKTAVVCSEASLAYENRPGYLESIERYRAVMLRLEESGLIPHVHRIPGRLAEREELRFCHDEDYIQIVEEDCRSGATVLSTGPKDTEIRPGTWTDALGAAGAAMTTVDWVIDEDFADLTRLMMKLAPVHCQGRVVSVMEGGYNVPGLASAVETHVGAYVQAG